MTTMNRRDVVKTLTALVVAGAVVRPGKAKAGGDAVTSLIITLIVLTLVTIIYLVISGQAFAAAPSDGKVVTGNRAKAAAQRAKSGGKAGTVRQAGDALYLDLTDKAAAQLASQRSINVSIPLPAGEGEALEVKLRKKNKRISGQLAAAGGKKGKNVGTIRMDGNGLALSISRARLG